MKKFSRYIICLSILLSSLSTIGIPNISAQSPEMPSGPYPAIGSTAVTIFINLRWSSSGSDITYDVYFGTESQPPLVVSHQPYTFYIPGDLTFNTTYYWQIIAFNNEEEYTSGPIWNFTTADDIAPYHATILTGPKNAGKEISLNFTAIAVDPDGDEVYYQWDWDDGNISSWFGPYAFGVYTKTSYQWMQNGTYNVKVRAKDLTGKISEWSAAYTVDIQTQIYFTTLRAGSVLLNAFGITLAYGYFYFMEQLGSTLIISNQGFDINVTVSENVYRVVFTMQNLLTEEMSTWEEDNITDIRSYGYFALDTGVYMTKAYGYDIHGNLIDTTPVEYIIYHQWKFRALKTLANLLKGSLIKG